MAGGSQKKGPRDKRPERRIICSSIETERAADLVLKVDQAVQALDRAVRADRINRRQQRERLDQIWQHLDAFEREFHSDVLQPARNLVRDVTRGPRAQGQRLSVDKGKVKGDTADNSGETGDSAGEAPKDESGQSSAKGSATDTGAAGSEAPGESDDLAAAVGDAE